MKNQEGVATFKISTFDDNDMEVMSIEMRGNTGGSAHFGSKPAEIRL